MHCESVSYIYVKDKTTIKFRKTVKPKGNVKSIVWNDVDLECFVYCTIIDRTIFIEVKEVKYCNVPY